MIRHGLSTALAGLLIAAAVFALPGCGGGGEGGLFDISNRETAFWAYDFGGNQYYRTRAVKVGEGVSCDIYLERGMDLPQAVVDNLVGAFDNAVYPRVRASFGSEPDPGIDNNPRVLLLLLDIRDTFNPPSDTSYVAGYFDPANEYRRDVEPNSNEREMLYMDIAQGNPSSRGFLRTIAHEFQHMVHFNEQVVSKGGAEDPAWLDEAMSEVAPVYCDMGPDYDRVETFEGEPWNSLTIWGNRVEDYGVVYMWAQYVRDRVDPDNTVFWRMLHNSWTGIPSVDNALADISYGKDFGGVFRDWAVACYAGTRIRWPAFPERSYASIDTWPGTHADSDGAMIVLAGLFGIPAKTNQGSLRTLEAWSVDFYLYTPLVDNTGTVAWTPGGPGGWASLGAADNQAFVYGLAPGVAVAYDNAGYLITADASDNGFTGGDNVVFTSLARGPATPSELLASDTAPLPGVTKRPATAAQMLAEAGRSPAVKRLVAMTGRPFPVCVQPFLKESVRPLKERGIRPFR